MAKIIKITDEVKAELENGIKEFLKSIKLTDGKINFTKSFANIKRDATVYFTSDAWNKMQALVKNFDKEVAWHGVAYRDEDPTVDAYYITDILVYPQEVTGATVNTDQSEYQTWLMNHDDDVFNNIRMQGHSHVNMGTTPSSVDCSLYERILDQLDDSMFYIFLIYNKRGEKTYKIYDMAKNILFETGDVTVQILESQETAPEIHGEGITDEEAAVLQKCLTEYRVKKEMDGFLKDAKELVKEKKYTAPTYTGYNGYNGGNYGGYYGGGYGGYNGGGYGYSSAAKPATTAEKKDDKPAAIAPVTKVPDKKDKKDKKGPRKGKRSKKYGNIVKFENALEKDDNYDIFDERDGGFYGIHSYTLED